MKLSVVIPAHNEQDCIEKTIIELLIALKKAEICHEIVCVNDNSEDATESVIKRLKCIHSEIKYFENNYPKGFGFAVRTGLERFTGNAVAIVMADGSDDPNDVVKFFHKLEEGYDCVFGSRFIKGGSTHDYPKLKLIINRLANLFVGILFGIKYYDITNAYKMYHRETIMGLRPIISHHFNLTVELPLKAITRGYSYCVLPNSWTNRTAGKSKLNLQEMGSRYLFIVFYCLIEKWLSVGDYKKDKQNILNENRKHAVTWN